MSKIICEVCGTSYPDSAVQCPICGCATPGGQPTADGDTEHSGKTESKNTQKPAVRGGRYSKANVRKRNKTVQSSAPTSKPTEKPDKKPEKKNESSKGLTILAIVLLLAILAMVIYIGVRFFRPLIDRQDTSTTTTDSNTVAIGSSEDQIPGQDSDQEDTTVGAQVCTDLKLNDSVVELSSKGQACLLNVVPVPSDTTDEIHYTSSDESVATVTSKGKIVAVAPGQAEITISCGDVKKTCRVVVSYAEDTTEAETTEAETTAPSQSSSETLKLNREDFTLSKKGETWQLYDGTIAKPLITWTSSNPSVATVEAGKVVGVGPGTATIYAEYDGQKVSCIVRCSFEAEIQGGFNTGVGEG